MEIRAHFLTPPHSCSYLPQETALLEYVDCRALSLEEYGILLEKGWRRFGRSIFRPRCPSCTGCQSLRILVDRFVPDRSQTRNARRNSARYELRIGQPTVTAEKLRLHDVYHQHQSEAIGWPKHPPKDEMSYHDSFVNNPFPTEEWCFYHRDRLVGVGYVDNVPALGLSAIYFFYDPAERAHGLGTWNVLQVIEQARRQNHRYVYLGYFVEGCRSLEYKARFHPHELLLSSGGWQLSQPHGTIKMP